MHLFYFLPVLAILLPEDKTLDIADNIITNTFAKLCFLPKTPVPFNVNAFIIDGKPSEKYYGVLGNDVMQQKLFKLLTDNQGKASQEDLEKLCYQTDVETIDDSGVLSGNLFGFENATANYTCQDSKDFPGVLRCNFKSASQKFDEDTLTYLSIANENFFFEIDCFKSGQVGWALYSKTAKISEEDKKFYSAYSTSLGFPENTNVILHGDNCAN